MDGEIDHDVCPVEKRAQFFPRGVGSVNGGIRVILDGFSHGEAMRPERPVMTMFMAIKVEGLKELELAEDGS